MFGFGRELFDFGAEVPEVFVVGEFAADAGFARDRRFDAGFEGGGVHTHLASEGVADDADAGGVGVGAGCYVVDDALEVPDPFAQGGDAGVADGEVVDGFVVAFAVGFSVPFDGDGEHAALVGLEGEGAGGTGGEAAAAQVSAGGGVDVVVGHDDDGEAAGGLAEGGGDEDAGGVGRFGFEVNEFAGPGGVLESLDWFGWRGLFGEVGRAEELLPVEAGEFGERGGLWVLELAEEFGVGWWWERRGCDGAGQAEAGEWAAAGGFHRAQQRLVPLGTAGEDAAAADDFGDAGWRALGVADGVEQRGGGVPILAPFPDVAGHVVETEFVGFSGGGGAGSGLGGVEEGLRVAVARVAEGRGVRRAVGAGPFGGGGEAVTCTFGPAGAGGEGVAGGEAFAGAEAVGEGDGVVPSDVFDREGGAFVGGRVGSGELLIFLLGDFGGREEEGAGLLARGDGPHVGGREGEGEQTE